MGSRFFDRVRGVIGIEARRVERRENRVALELVDDAVVPSQRFGGRCVEHVERAHELVRREPLG
jgi:hypothetical protein